MESKKINTLIIQLALSVFIALLGLGLGTHTFRESSLQLITESQQHLEDIAKSVDQNTDNVFKRVQADLSFSVENFPDALDRSSLAANPLVSDIILIDRDGSLISCLGKQNMGYSIKSIHEDIGLCLDAQAVNYLLFTQEQDGIIYGALVDLNNFYQNIVVTSITYHYWIVFYERASTLMLQNEYEQPTYLLLSPEEIIQRNDGYSLLHDREVANDSGTDRYSYVNDDNGKTEYCQMSVLTSADSRNRVFAIGVAADTVAITKILQQAMLWLSLSAVLILLSLILLLYSVMNHRRKANAVARQLEITKELLEKQTVLERNQRLEALGVMTSSIAHEFNNLLTPITGYSLLCLEKVPEDTEVYDNLLAIYQAADKARVTVRRISALTRKTKETECFMVCPDEIVARVLELSAPSKPKTVEIKTGLNCENVQFFVNETQILQVLLNLLLNAYQAMEETGGTVLVSTVQQGHDILFRITDTGPGIPAQLLPRIFDPFFTTKETGKGSGLGLAIARQVAESHQGDISVVSKEGHGASFTLRIPIRSSNS